MFRNTKIVVAAFAALAMPAMTTPVLAQDEPEQARTSYQIILLKLAPGADERWTELTETYFAPSAKAAGLPATQIHWMMDGNWDLMLVRPMPRGMAALDTHASPERKAYWAQLIKLTGSEEKAQALSDESDKLVSESVRYFSHTHP